MRIVSIEGGEETSIIITQVGPFTETSTEVLTETVSGDEKDLTIFRDSHDK